jgi:hypothetical protein
MLNTNDFPTRTPALPIVHNSSSTVPAIFDSGTTCHYILLDTPCHSKRTTGTPISVTLPNGQSITSSHEATLPFPGLPLDALNAHVFPGLRGHALLSIGAFCDAGCTATFSATTVTIQRDGKVVLTGQREPPGLWKTNPTAAPNATPWAANGVFTRQIKTDAIQFLHAACFSPTTATWIKAIDRGHFKSWPLPATTRTIRQLLPQSNSNGAHGPTTQKSA